MVKKNLLILTSTFPQGADDAITARFVYDLARGMTNYFNVFVLAPKGRNARGFETMDGIAVHRFQYFFPQNWALLMGPEGMLTSMNKNPLAILQVPFFMTAALFSTMLFIRKKKIDIVNTHWIVPNGFILGLLKGVLKVPHMMTVHAADIFALKRAGNIGRLLCRYTVRKSDLLLPVSTYIRDCVKEVSCVNFNHAVIPMGVDLNKFKPSNALKKDGFTFLFVGKFVEKKGLKFLLEAMKIIKGKIDGIRLIVVGGGPYEMQYKDYVLKAGLEGQVKFYGWVSNDKLNALYNESDALVVPSVFDKKGETEGMPVVILEAFACGIPVIASRISGVPDVVKDLYNGLLFRPGDADELADKMAQICKSGIDAYRQNCITTASVYSTDNLAKKYYEHAAGLMAKERRAS